MKCPYCSGEMEKGHLQGNQRIAWVKTRHKVSLMPRKGEILLENNSLNSFFMEAHICKSCKKIIVDYTGEDVQEKE